MTRYQILIGHDLEDNKDGWLEHIQLDAASDTAAIRKAAKNGPGRFAAIPLRSWKPTLVEVETVSRVKLSQPTATTKPKEDKP